MYLKRVAGYYSSLNYITALLGILASEFNCLYIYHGSAIIEVSSSKGLT